MGVPRLGVGENGGSKSVLTGR